MNEILKNSLMILSGIIGGTLFVFIKNKIFNTAKKEVVKIIPEADKAKVKELYEKGLVPEKLYKEVCETPEPKEGFSTKKFLSGMLNIGSSVGWAKDIASIFNLRKLIIIGVIIGVIFGYGYYKGKINKPVKFNLNYESEMTIPVPNGAKAFHKPKNSSEAYWLMEDGSKRVIIVKDIPELRKVLKPYGFIFEPILVGGGSLGEGGAGWDIGAGISWFKWFRAKVDSFITNRGFYPVGISYGLTAHSGIGLGGGIGYKGDKRVILYYKWRF